MGSRYILLLAACITIACILQLSTGWRFKKRPGLDYFLQQVGFPVFEVVIYTHEQGFVCICFKIIFISVDLSC